MIPARLQDDARELEQLTGCRVSLLEDSGRILVIVEGARLPAGTYSVDTSDVLMLTDYQYPMSAMDNFYLQVEVQHCGGPIPAHASTVEAHGGRQWRRWSWHRNGRWTPSADGLLSHWMFIEHAWAQESRK